MGLEGSLMVPQVPTRFLDLVSQARRAVADHKLDDNEKRELIASATADGVVTKEEMGFLQGFLANSNETAEAIKQKGANFDVSALKLGDNAKTVALMAEQGLAGRRITGLPQASIDPDRLRILAAQTRVGHGQPLNFQSQAGREAILNKLSQFNMRTHFEKANMGCMATSLVGLAVLAGPEKLAALAHAVMLNGPERKALEDKMRSGNFTMADLARLQEVVYDYLNGIAGTAQDGVTAEAVTEFLKMSPELAPLFANGHGLRIVSTQGDGVGNHVVAEFRRRDGNYAIFDPWEQHADGGGHVIADPKRTASYREATASGIGTRVREQMTMLRHRLEGPAAPPATTTPPGLEAGGAGLPNTAAAGEKAFAETARRPFPLDSPAGRIQLIKHSPQTDSLSQTQRDRIRCGGAAGGNAVILDSGTPAARQANAKAIRALCQKLALTLTPDQETSLRGLEKGQMTPTDVAHLQEMMFTLAASLSPSGDAGSGLTVGHMSALFAAMRERGGLAHSTYITAHLAMVDDTPHWTLTQFGPPGIRGGIHANSWPDEHGHAVVDHNMHPERGMLVKGQPNDQWGGEVEIQNLTGHHPSVITSMNSQTGRSSPYYLMHERDIVPGTISADYDILGAKLFSRKTLSEVAAPTK